MDKNADGRITEQEVKEVILPHVALNFARLIHLYRDYCKTIVIIIIMPIEFLFAQLCKLNFTNLIFDDE